MTRIDDDFSNWIVFPSVRYLKDYSKILESDD